MLDTVLFYYVMGMIQWVYTYRRIFVYNICLITISYTISDGATKRLIPGGALGISGWGSAAGPWNP